MGWFNKYSGGVAVERGAAKKYLLERITLRSLFMFGTGRSVTQLRCAEERADQRRHPISSHLRFLPGCRRERQGTGRPRRLTSRVLASRK
jgi:hypothetical protein